MESRQGALPPAVQLVSSAAGHFTAVCYDVESTGLDLLEDRIVQFGAFCRLNTHDEVFSQYILPEYRRVNPQASKVIELQVQGDGCDRRLVDLRTGEKLDTVCERDGILNFLRWLESIRAGAGSDGVILMSHGAIFLDIILLIRALWAHDLTQEFFTTVKGFTDTNAVFLDIPQFPKISLQQLYQQIVGRRDTMGHRGHDDARDLYELLEKYFKAPPSLDIPEISRSTFRPDCMLKYVAWRQDKEPTRTGLYRITEGLALKSKKRTQDILNSLILGDMSYDKLLQDFTRSTPLEFKEKLHLCLKTARNKYVNYLTDVRDANPQHVADQVTKYFVKFHSNLARTQ